MFWGLLLLLSIVEGRQHEYCEYLYSSRIKQCFGDIYEVDSSHYSSDAWMSIADEVVNYTVIGVKNVSNTYGVNYKFSLNVDLLDNLGDRTSLFSFKLNRAPRTLESRGSGTVAALGLIFKVVNGVLGTKITVDTSPPRNNSYEEETSRVGEVYFMQQNFIDFPNKNQSEMDSVSANIYKAVTRGEILRGFTERVQKRYQLSSSSVWFRGVCFLTPVYNVCGNITEYGPGDEVIFFDGSSSLFPAFNFSLTEVTHGAARTTMRLDSLFDVLLKSVDSKSYSDDYSNYNRKSYYKDIKIFPKNGQAVLLNLNFSLALTKVTLELPGEAWAVTAILESRLRERSAQLLVIENDFFISHEAEEGTVLLNTTLLYTGERMAPISCNFTELARARLVDLKNEKLQPIMQHLAAFGENDAKSMLEPLVTNLRLEPGKIDDVIKLVKNWINVRMADFKESYADTFSENLEDSEILRRLITPFLRFVGI